MLRALFVGATLMVLSLSAHADLDDALDQMYVATGTELQNYESQRRLGMAFGTYRLRIPMNNVSVINLTPPEIRAGCGGIDLYGGSFSFINTAQFRQTLRQIGANAVGYAFQLALKSMCDACNQIITGLQDMMNAFTRMNVDTCKWAQGLVNDTVKSFAHEADVKGMSDATYENTVGDMIEAATEAFAVPGRWLANGSATGADPANPSAGNITYNALTLVSAETLVLFPAGNLDVKELLMNVAGTALLRAPTSAEISAGSKGEYQTLAGPFITYSEFKEGKAKAGATSNDVDKVHKCDESVQCLNPVPLDEWSFKGVDEWVRLQLTNVAAYYKSPITTALPSATTTFLGASPIPITYHMVELQGTSAVDGYIAQVSPFLADMYASELALRLVTVVERAFQHPKAGLMPPQTRAALDEFRRQANADAARVRGEYSRTLVDLEEWVTSATGTERSRRAATRPGGDRG
jgi:conjugative transfer pilus assembly protein TraH